MTTTDQSPTLPVEATTERSEAPPRHRRVAVLVGVLGVLATTAVLVVGAAVSVSDGSFTEAPDLSDLLVRAPQSPRVVELAADASDVEAGVREAVQRAAWWFDAVAAQRAERVPVD